MTDDFDEKFPGWRARPKKRVSADEQRGLDEEHGWIARPSAKIDDDVYAELRSRDE